VRGGGGQVRERGGQVKGPQLMETQFPRRGEGGGGQVSILIFFPLNSAMSAWRQRCSGGGGGGGRNLRVLMGMEAGSEGERGIRKGSVEHLLMRLKHPWSPRDRILLFWPIKSNGLHLFMYRIV
jgi:hypothetical protein